jgi:hypothetical protein
MIFYHAEVIVKLYELSRYKILSSYNVTKSIKCFGLYCRVLKCYIKNY